MAGGVGRRLWPVSRQQHPKQFIDFFGTGRSLLQLTYDRVSRFVAQENIYVCTSEEYADLTRQQLPVLTDEQLLLEPVRLSTAPAAAWASWHIGRRNPNANVLVTPADQIITDEAAFERELTGALEYVATHDEFLAIGVPAREPNTAYGYIQKAAPAADATASAAGAKKSAAGATVAAAGATVADDDATATAAGAKKSGAGAAKSAADGRAANLFRVKTFTEKPPLEYATTFVRSGEFLWNAGIFLWNVATMSRLEEEIIPGLSHSDIIISSLEEERALVRLCYPSATREALDGTLLETQPMAVCECTFGWSDVGSWPVMGSVLPHTADGNAVVVTPAAPGTEPLAAPVTFKGCADTIVSVPANVAAVVRGLKGYVVALEGNVLVITPNDDPARMRRYSAELQVKYGEEYL